MALTIQTMLAWITLYFLLVVTTLALLFLPGLRQWALARLCAARARKAQITTQLAHHGRAHVEQVSDSVGFHAGSALAWLRTHANWVGAGAALIMALPLAALALQGWLDLNGFDHRQTRQVNEQIAELLQGEQLVPPPPLPPEMFSTQEVELVRPMTRSASREWNLLDEVFRQRLLIVFKIMKEQHGYEMVLLEGYRSPERQARLAGLGGHVTRAGAFRSYHQFGLAADSAFLRNGKVVISERDPWAMKGYEHYGEVAQSVGLTWGGSWRSIKDYGHIELRRPGVLGKAPAQGSDNATPSDFSGDMHGAL